MLKPSRSAFIFPFPFIHIITVQNASAVKVQHPAARETKPRHKIVIHSFLHPE